jgi:alpha-D-xyloside xylohydrolase
MQKSLTFLCCLVVAISVATLSATPFILPGDYSKTEDGIIVHVKRKTANGVYLVRLQAITDRIIRVTASPIDSIINTPSLITVAKKRQPVKWTIKEDKEQVTLLTPALRAVVSLITGEVGFTDLEGRPILAEPKEGGKSFVAVAEDGQPSYRLSQSFAGEPNEALYGLGQHQNGAMNYKGQQVELLQFNTEVAIPFMVSSKNYGILWDNYSVTKVGDTRDYEPLSSLRLYAKDGSAGWLTATYAKKSAPGEVLVERPESVLSYDYLSDQIRFPTGVKLDAAVVNWEGSIESSFTGVHQFLFRYGGYGKLWVDGKLLADRWRQSWNPGTAILPVAMEKGKKYRFRIEWTPDGGESYISCKWLSPLQGAHKDQFAFCSESGSQVDYYFIRGNNLDEVIAGYRDLTGASSIVPKWAMGLWQSRERYRTQDEILNTVQTFRAKKIPLDNIVLDWSYWKENDWGSQEFDATRFANPAGMIKTLHEQYNTHFMISVWPKFYEGIAAYDHFNKNGWLYKRNIAEKRRDWIGKGYTSTFYDAYNPKARTAFWNLINEKLYNKGIDAWWLDATEPDIHSNLGPAERKDFMNPTALGSATRYFNAFPLENAKAVYEGQRSVNPDQRVFILTRSAFAGQQRYAAATWSGDISARWHDFKDQVPAGLNFSLSGLPFWTTDIGGFAVERRYENAKGEDLVEWRELMTRWYQFGAFCPLFRVHGQFPYREIFNIAPEEHPAYQSMLYYDKLRYRLMPYIYSLAGSTYHDHYTIMRGLVMDFGADSTVKNIGDQYMFGPALLVNPVCEYKATSRQLYLPAGTGWYDFYAGAYTAGGQTITAKAPLERMPLFVKEGSVIPVGPEIQYTTEKPADPITLFVYTGKDGQFSLYEDENTNYQYEKGAFSHIPFRYEETTKTLFIDDRKGEFPGMLKERTFRIVWISKEKPRAFEPDGKADQVIKYKGKKITVRMK